MLWFAGRTRAQCHAICTIAPLTSGCCFCVCRGNDASLPLPTARSAAATATSPSEVFRAVTEAKNSRALISVNVIVHPHSPCARPHEPCQPSGLQSACVRSHNKSIAIRRMRH